MFQAVILAAGKGTRMKSETPKVLHPLAGRPMIDYVLDAAHEAGIRNISVVVGFGANEVIETVNRWSLEHPESQISFCSQETQLGTGHALKMAEKSAKEKSPYLIVLLGDVPLIKSETIRAACRKMESDGASAMVISAIQKDPHGYGRILRNGNGSIEHIIEEKDASEEQKSITEVNTGIFLFKDNDLWNYLHRLEPKNSQKEYYLTDIIQLISEDGKLVDVYRSDDPEQFTGINSIENLQNLERELQIRA